MSAGGGDVQQESSEGAELGCCGDEPWLRSESSSFRVWAEPGCNANREDGNEQGNNREANGLHTQPDAGLADSPVPAHRENDKNDRSNGEIAWQVRRREFLTALKRKAFDVMQSGQCSRETSDLKYPPCLHSILPRLTFPIDAIPRLQKTMQ